MNNIKPNTLSLILLAAIASFAAIVITPAIPALALAFHSRSSTMEWALSAYLIGYAGGQLLWAPLSDRIGRKRTLQIGMLVGLTMTLLCLLAGMLHAFVLFALARLVMGIGFSSGLVMSMAMIADTHTHTESRQKFSVIVLCFALVPAIAIVVGGVITQHLNFQYINLFIILIAMIGFTCATRLRETLPAESWRNHRIAKITLNYFTLMKHTKYRLFIIIYALVASISYVFNGLSPIIGIQLDHVPVQTFSFISILASGGILLGGFLSNQLAQKYNATKLIFAGLMLIIFASSAMLCFFLWKNLSLIPLFICAFVMFVGVSLVIPNASMSAVHAVGGSASAAGFMNAFGLCVASMLAYLSALIVLHKPSILPLCLLTSGLISLLLLGFLQYNGQRSKTHLSEEEIWGSSHKGSIIYPEKD